ncbi:MAG: hypothetical protein H0V09_07650 [Gemmatimonadetes bacterium]|nr:hypothetical protein [Gemmatimonadota bacterium]
MTVRFGEVSGRVVSVEPGIVVVEVPLEILPGEVTLTLEVRGVAAVATAVVAIVVPSAAFRSLSAGSGFTCGVLREGGASCWGIGVSGQLGSGPALIQSLLPVPVSGGGTYVAVSSGSAHTCGIDGAGTAHCWGKNDEGQLGSGGTSSSTVPTAVAGGLTFESVSAGIFHTCGLVASGEAFCWGDNTHGQLGEGTSTPSLVPVRVAGGLHFTTLSTGGFHTCGIEASAVGRLHCWGRNAHGELGNGTRTDAAVPVPVAGGPSFAVVSAGRQPPVGLAAVGEHTCGITRDGQAYCWGFNEQGQLGNGGGGESLTPVRVSDNRGFVSIAAGAFHTCGVTAGGEALCWGANDAGQLGTALLNPSFATPVPVLGRLRFSSITAGGASKSSLRGVRAHTCALTPEGFAFCWGRNGSGQLGAGFSGEQSLPVVVGG